MGFSGTHHNPPDSNPSSSPDPGKSSRIERGRPPPGESVSVAIDGFEILELLGKGGMGAVYLAHDPVLNRVVALKLLEQTEGDAGAGAAARFLREAVLTGRLNHAGIVPIHRVGFDPRCGYYYCMRYLRGRTLDRLLAERGQQAGVSESVRQTRLLHLFVRVCEAVAHAHRHGVVHRDLKPSNVMLTDADEVFVLDWGVAKDLGTWDPLGEWKRDPEDAPRAEACLNRHQETSRALLAQARGRRSLADRFKGLFAGPPGKPEGELDGLTLKGTVVGTPQYMSPEQCRGLTLTSASDVYALGAILYRILTGQPPVEPGTPEQMMRRTVKGQVRHLDALPEAFQIPRVLCDIVGRALALAPEQRYPDAGRLAETVSNYLEGRPPLQPLAAHDFVAGSGSGWRAEASAESRDGEGLVCPEGAVLRCEKRSLGDLLCRVVFRARESDAWRIALELIDAEGASQYEVRLGTDDRHHLELLQKGQRKQRRFDLRLQRECDYRLEVELEDGHVVVRLDGIPYVNYAEDFPLIGGTVSLRASVGDILVLRAELFSRGAPLRMPFLSLPDQLYRQGRFAEARELYRQVSDSHADRPEGLLAVYKIGLCEAALENRPAAFRTFSSLKGTMYDHCAVLGFARIGSHADNFEWAWESLKNGYLRHRSPDVRTEFWFALLGIIESLGDDALDKKLRRYRELLKDLEPSDEEASQVAFEFLDLVDRTFGPARLHVEALALLDAGLRQQVVNAVAILSLWRHGLDMKTALRVQDALQALPSEVRQGPNQVRLLLLSCEIKMAGGHYEPARQRLRDVLEVSGPDRPDSIWAKGWQLLAAYAQEKHGEVLEEAMGITRYERIASLQQVAYLRVMLATNFLALGKKERATELFTVAARTKGVWGEAARCLLKQTPPEHWKAIAAGPNLLTEALFLIGDGHRHLGHKDLAAAYFAACEAHPSHRAMTRRLAQIRLGRQP